jgi:hypothetical protein
MTDKPIDIDPCPDEPFGQWLSRAMEALGPSDYATAALNRERPYNGQPHTAEGIRGATLVEGLTMRDVKDCFVIGAYRSMGKPMEEYPATIYDIDWNDLDPMAVCQNMLCAVEERMGIFPNVPKLTEPPS